MRLPKPQPGVCLDRAHPLSQGLVACWLLNEGTGNQVHDGAGVQTIAANPAPTWGPGRCEFNGVDQMFFGDVTIDLEKDFTIVTTVRTDPVSVERVAIGLGDPAYGCRFVLGVYSSGRYRCLLRQDDNSNVVNVYAQGDAFDDGRPHQLAFSFVPSAGAVHCLLDGTVLSSAAPSNYTGIHAHKVAIGSEYRLGSFARHWSGSIYHVYLYRRALAPSEIVQLYGRPYAMFTRPVALVAVSLTGTVHDLAGSIVADTACDATLRVSAFQSSLARGDAWGNDALFNGMTAQALKLGTTLTQGWFWMRPAGCSAVYRGSNLREVDFDSVVCVADPQAGQIVLPTYLAHEPGASCCYVVRRFNSCGHQELTTTALVSVAIGPDGKLVEPAPNPVFGLAAQRTGGNRIRLRWFYCPLQQRTAPAAFNVCDERGTVLGTVAYAGHGHYRYCTDPLPPGRYMLAVRAASAAGVESVTPTTVSCSIETQALEAATIFAQEAMS
jgi:hypothetical protein